MRFAVYGLLLLATAGVISAQRHKIGEVNAEKPEGQLLQQIGQESDATKKLALMEQFIAQYPKHEAAGWVLEQMQPAYVKSGAIDKVIEAGIKLTALDPDDTEAALQTLKAVETKKDPALIMKWSAAASAAARKMVAAPQPSNASEVEAWKNSVDYARQVDTYTEYALYRAALEIPDPNVRIELGEALLARNAKSEYAAKVAGPLFLAYQQKGAKDKALALAERTLAVDQSSEDMLIVVADHYMQGNREQEKIHAYTAKVVQLVDTKTMPEGVDAAAWKKRNDTLKGLAQYMSGKVYFNANQFAPADKQLRGALPLVEANPDMKAEVLFMLGMANYKMEKAQEAANFFKACSALKSPFQSRALQNIKAIRAQYTGIK